jgi:hypothetical protein
MSFFLTEEQEEALNFILDEENKKICEEQLNSEDFPEELKEIVRKTVEAGAPIPAFDPQVGYYTISFTPCEDGNRIYLHHHLTNVSKAIYDPILPILQDQSEEISEEQVEVLQEEIDTPQTEIIDPSTFGGVAPEYTNEQLEAMFGAPPKEITEMIPQPQS